jgi:acetyltransferase-like isoleucine patch superfamily enzyme
MPEYKSRELPPAVKKIIKYLYRHSGFPVRPLLRNFVLRSEGGEYWTITLREIYAEIHKIKIGMGSYGCFRSDAFPPGTVVGNYCSIAENVRVVGSNHPYGFVSTHPLFYQKEIGFIDKDKVVRVNCEISHDVWIGYNSLILPGCQKIGIGAVIGAGSVVTKDVEPFTVVVGAPAKPLKKRFDVKTIQALTQSCWYLLEPKVLSEVANDGSDPELFLKKIESHIPGKFDNGEDDIAK